MEKRNLLILLVFLFAWLPCLAASDAQALKDILSQTQTMQATFEQFVISKNDKNQSHIIGQMALIRPNQFRWEVKSPNQQLIIANNKQVLIYDADLQQVTKQKINFNQLGNPAMLLSGSLDTLDNLFIIKQLKMPGIGTWFQLTPKTSNNNYQWLKLHFVTNEIVAMYVLDNLGQEIEISFENVIINAQIPSADFVFKMPKNADVVDEGENKV